jgi:hypothetical protein
VAAIVLNNKNAYQKQSVDGRQTESNPPGVISAPVHQSPQADIRQKGIDHLKHSFSSTGLRVFLKKSWPVLESLTQLVILLLIGHKV